MFFPLLESWYLSSTHTPLTRAFVFVVCLHACFVGVGFCSVFKRKLEILNNLKFPKLSSEARRNKEWKMRERKNLGEKEENIKGKCRRDKENMINLLGSQD